MSSSSTAGWPTFGALALASLLATGSARAETTTYTYDVYGQLRRADPNPGGVVTYGYDAAGNRVALGLGTNTAPVAINDTVSTTFNHALTFDPRINDTDANGDLLSISTRTNPSHGALAINAGASLTYTPIAGYQGADSFTYTISDGNGGKSTATVSMTVVNSPPAAVADMMTLFYMTAPTVSTRPTGAIDPRTNDSDPEGDPLTVTAKTNGARGTVAITGGGTTVTYTYSTTVRPTFTDTDSFTYTISDGQGHTATATVTVDIDVENNE